MSSSVIKKFRVDRVIILDWYDGIVSAIATQQGKSYWLGLVAWNIDEGRKALIFVELSSSLATTVERLAKEAEDETIKASRWTEYNDLLEKYLSNYQGEVYLACDEPMIGRDSTVSLISAEHLRQIKSHGIESADTPEARDFWFALASACNL